VDSLDSLVIDEADLILSYGHGEDIRQIFHGGFLPQVFQSFLMSATMTEDVELLKGLALRNPVCSIQSEYIDLRWPVLKAILKLEEDEDEAANLSQYSVKSVLELCSCFAYVLRPTLDVLKSTSSYWHMSSSNSSLSRANASSSSIMSIEVIVWSYSWNSFP
jgi:hypothetical protein